MALVTLNIMVKITGRLILMFNKAKTKNCLGNLFCKCTFTLYLHGKNELCKIDKEVSNFRPFLHYLKGLPTISAPEISARVISARMFHHRNISARGHFRTWTFPHSSTGAVMSVPKCPYCFARCKNIHVLKCSGAEISRAEISRAEISRAEMSMALKIPCAKNFPCRKVSKSKCSRDETSICRNVRKTKMHVLKCSQDEKSLLK